MPETNVQQQLFARPSSLEYEWKNIQEVKKGELIVVQQRETKILSVKQSGNDWILTFTDPISGEKAEQIYNAHDSVYFKK